jgi:hypothetical protein
VFKQVLGSIVALRTTDNGLRGVVLVLRSCSVSELGSVSPSTRMTSSCYGKMQNDSKHLEGKKGKLRRTSLVSISVGISALHVWIKCEARSGSASHVDLTRVAVLAWMISESFLEPICSTSLQGPFEKSDRLVVSGDLSIPPFLVEFS